MLAVATERGWFFGFDLQLSNDVALNLHLEDQSLIFLFKLLFFNCQVSVVLVDIEGLDVNFILADKEDADFQEDV